MLSFATKAKQPRTTRSWDFNSSSSSALEEKNQEMMMSLLLSSTLEEKNIKNDNKLGATKAKQARTTTSQSPDLLLSFKIEEKNTEDNCN